MRTKNTASLGLSLYLFGCETGETSKYVDLVWENNYVVYQFVNRDLELILQHVEKCKHENCQIEVSDFMKAEHLIGELKRRCRDERNKL